MTDNHCCDQGRRLVSAHHFTERDLAAAARRASMTAHRRGKAHPAQLADIAKYRSEKAAAADAIADHEEFCTAAVTR